MKKVEIEMAVIDSKQRICLFFPYDDSVIQQVKTIPGARWSPRFKCWHIAPLFGPAEKLNYRFREKLEFILRQCETPADVEPAYPHVPEEFVKTLKVRQYSEKTIETYTSMLHLFIRYIKPRNIDETTDEEAREYLLYLVDRKKVSQSYQNQAINAIKFYYEKVLGRPVSSYYLSRPRREKVLPNVLSEEEVVRLLRTIDNLKHFTVLSLIYSSGLRIGEAINLKIEDIDSLRGQIRVRQGKGKKDRVSVLSLKMLPLLRKYYREYRPKVWLFEGQFGGQYSSRSIQIVFKEAKESANIRKKVTVHTLRHSFATHLLERGTSLRYIQDLLGHASSRTTEIYTHITNKGFTKITSPFDMMDI
jgi:integrase/recombinase XerD